MRRALLFVAMVTGLATMWAGTTMEELGKGVCDALAAQDFARLRPHVLNADDVSYFLNLTTQSEEYNQMSPDEKYLVDAWLQEAKHTTRQELEFHLYKLQQQFDKLLAKGADMYGIRWEAIQYEGTTYGDELTSGVQRIRQDVKVTFSFGGQRYDVLLAGATYAKDGWKAQYESIRLVRSR